jgi:hypothetical protein
MDSNLKFINIFGINFCCGYCEVHSLYIESVKNAIYSKIILGDLLFEETEELIGWAS